MEQEAAEEAEAAAMSEDEVEEVAPPLQSSAADADIDDLRVATDG